MDRPFWGVDDPSMPLPFDLADIITRVESLLWRWALRTRALTCSSFRQNWKGRFTFASLRDSDLTGGAQVKPPQQI